MRSGHWGLSFLRQEWREVSVCGDLECYGATGSVRLRGVTANWFVPFGSPFAGDRLQVGMHVDAGAGWFQGNVRVDEVFEGGLPLDREGTEVPAHELLPDGWQDVPLPLFRAEVAVAVTVAPGLKVIGSGGYGFPFRRRIGISVTYFPMAALRLTLSLVLPRPARGRQVGAQSDMTTVRARLAWEHPSESPRSP